MQKSLPEKLGGQCNGNGDQAKTRINVKTKTEQKLNKKLAAFDPKKHGGEAMAGGAVGVEAFANGQGVNLRFGN
jgi:hypothetical protein